MDFIVNLLVSAGVILLLANAMSSVHVKSFWTALWVAFLIGIFNATIGWLLSGVLNLVSFFLLEAIVSLIVTALMIKLVDVLVGNFKVDGFWPALVIAIATAIAVAIAGWIGGDDEESFAQLQETRQPKTEVVLAGR
ncbi:putative membrane protein [Pontibacter ummariensis]|uniref:Putative membrane protein n=1 Tax=Pontibacter ummariensis TaxID=1610492 RepID=A0A239BRX7_9BACT|nr:phage holin family protein [Pontibacter ummariensis]PRY15678.1 putative membrane protein [Pontibacter ummariensis]SNS10168.1 putative membrane protein [Pontibacter ummariensis]